MLYRVHAQGPQGPIELDFVLDSNPLVEIWLDCLRTQLALPWKISELQWVRTWTTEASLTRARLELEATCIELNVHQHLNDLNRLHLLFHQHYEQGGVDDPQWNRLNKRIHKLEEQQRSIGVTTSQRTGFGMFVCDNLERVEQRPIPPELRSYWAHVPRSGELLLGYYTLGKTISDCVRDNDLDCVRSGMVRAQQTISTETLCLWSPSPGILKRPLTLRQIEQWVKDNQLEGHIDLGLAEHQYSGAPRLGEYVGGLTTEQLNSCLANAEIVSAELID